MTVLPQTGELAPANEPWRLIRDAIADLELQEQTEGVRIDMGTWHAPEDGVCRQCLAGCVMSRRLGADLEIYIDPIDLDKSIYMRLAALDRFRCGDVWSAYAAMLTPIPLGVHAYVAVADYDKNPAQFKADMLALADMLEAAHANEQPDTPIRRSPAWMQPSPARLPS